MQSMVYDRIKETIYNEQMPNGLNVFVLPKEGFQKTYATFSTPYGSIHNHFQVEGNDPVKVPDGIAHFLEHKMFEEPTGDIFAAFASQGASANAFTGFARTTYLFSATEQVANNLETLLNFVQHPYFTDENVEKEKGIINQEINMYKDNPDWRNYFGLIEAMYSVHPVHIDIAGTEDSIAKISKEMLYACYNTFYHPGNMTLFVVGGVNPQEVMQLVRDNQYNKAYEPQGAIRLFFEEEPAHVKTSKNVILLPVSMPKCLFGFKETNTGLTGRSLLENECETKLVLDCLFSASSPLYQTLYDERMITDQFSYEYNCHTDYAFSVIGGETDDPDLLLTRVREELDQVFRGGLDLVRFERSRRKKIGSFLRMLNSPEALANEFTNYFFRDQELFDILTIYEEMRLEQVNDRMRRHFDWDHLAVSIVRSVAP